MLRVVLLSCIATTAAAETPLSIEKFRAMVEGNAYFHAFEQGPPFGIMSYHMGGANIWWDQQTDCVFGRYAAGSGTQICSHENRGDFSFCWTFYATDTGFRAIGEDGTPFIMTQTSEPLSCQGQDQS